MINKFSLIRNIGSFDSVSNGGNLPLERLTLIFAENGRGKTTLAAIIRSLSTGDSNPIAERQRLASQNPPHVVLDCLGGPPDAMFMNGAWNRSLPDITIFDDAFVDQNVYSGLVVDSSHRQNLHELILGSTGVALNQTLQSLVSQIETHNSALRNKSAAIPTADRGPLSVDDFCDLQPRTDIDDAILSGERALAAAQQQQSVASTQAFGAVSLPAFNVEAIQQVLRSDLASLDATAVERVRVHFQSLGDHGEAWVSAGMVHLSHAETNSDDSTCPFCAQSLVGSPLIDRYRAYFSHEYIALKDSIASSVASVVQTHGGDVPAAFERGVRVLTERRQFWAAFCEVPEVTVDTAQIARDWKAARDAVSAALQIKQNNPLEPAQLSATAITAIEAYEAHRQSLQTLNAALQSTNADIALVKEQALTADPASISADLMRLRAVKARYQPSNVILCNAYLAEKAAKTATEQLRDQAATALQQYRTTVFPAYQTAINIYLQRFGAGFRLDRVTSANTRGGPTCNYDVVINNTPVPLSATQGQATPSFRSTLSSGDRNTLALAFFFALLDQDPSLAQKVIVIDDPVSSLDDHRTLTTVQEIRRLATRTSQVIVLSHNRSFLCRIWEGATHTPRSAIQVTRGAHGSTLDLWNVDDDAITEHDKRHELVRAYLAQGGANGQEVAAALRPILEAFLRVASPEYFPPGMLLGPFLNICQQRVGTSAAILNQADTTELGDLLEYANRFHHDTNPAWETESINDGELRGFAERVVRFARR